MVKFDDVLKVDGDGKVVAGGPVDTAKETIVDLCAWVYQRGDKDAAATEMHIHDHHAPGEGELLVADDHWSMTLARVGDERLKPGDAFAVAVAMIGEKGKQEVIWWGHPVKLES